MPSIQDIISHLQAVAPLALQEPYDNSGLLTGIANDPCTGIICALDATEDVINEAIVAGANLIVTHHPIIFKPLKSITPESINERALIQAIKNNIAIYAIHTNYDNVLMGVNRALALEIGLKKESLSILAPMQGKICKLFTYVPHEFVQQLKTALFDAGAGKIGLYEECSFELKGMGTFKPQAGSNPFIGKAAGERETVDEAKIEVIFPIWLINNILRALKENHPYEEVAYEIIRTENLHQEVGAGMIGTLDNPMEVNEFLDDLKRKLGLKMLRHTEITKKHFQKVAICGGAGSFLIRDAIAAKADVFLTADLKYHDFFEADGKITMVDIGHYESEIPAIAQLTNNLKEKFPTFAVLQTKMVTNPVQYR
jgi:dinuclear metal center YbgI/SA1388 family protein